MLSYVDQAGGRVDAMPRLSQTPHIKVSEPQIKMNTPTLYMTEKKSSTPQSIKKSVNSTPNISQCKATITHAGILYYIIILKY